MCLCRQKLNIFSQVWKPIKRKAYGNLQITQAIAKTIGCFPQSNSKTLLLKTVSTYLTEHGEVNLVSD